MLEPADLDGDGKVELIAATNRGPRVWRFAGGEEGYVEDIEGLPTTDIGGSNQSIAAYDFDGDGMLELIVGGQPHSGHPPLQIFRRGKGETAWSSWGKGHRILESEVAPHAFIDITVGHFGPDAKPSIVLADKWGALIVDYKGGDQFAMRGLIENTSALENVFAADVDGDNIDEIAVSTKRGVWMLDLVTD